MYRHQFPLVPLVNDANEPNVADIPGSRVPSRVAGTGTTEGRIPAALTPGRSYLLIAEANGVRVRFSANPAIAAGSAVDATRDVAIGPWQSMEFVADKLAAYVYAEAADGASAYALTLIKTN
jgi:hypothetical protein